MIKILRRHPAAAYFILTFFISWSGAFALVAGKIIHKETIPKGDGILMFPLMLLGPFLSGLIMSYVTGGKKSLADIKSRLSPSKLPVKWLLPVLIAPVSILIALTILSQTVSGNTHPIFSRWDSYLAFLRESWK